jgi:methyl-accepting chemotaxis protein
VRQSLAALGPALSAYIDHANKIVALAAADPSAARSEFPKFLETFEVLEADLSDASDKIQLAAEAINASVADQAFALRMALISAIALAVVGISAASLWTARSIVNPIVEMTAAMVRLANGDKMAVIPALGRSDEIGRMASAVQVFKDNTIRAEELAQSQAADQKRREQRAIELESLCRNFDSIASKALKSVVDSVSGMQLTAQSMANVARDSVGESAHVNEAAQAATTNVTSVASATEELASSVTEISRQMSRSTAIASQAANQAESTNAQIRNLAAAAQKVGDVVRLITDIANQTNLLALNATIEAARAGEAGRGFAVVASEVKSLANQTANATEEIAQQINSIQAETSEAVSAIHAIAGTIDEINQITSAVAAAVEEQGAATQEIARSVERAADGTREVSNRMHSVSQAANQAGEAAGQLLHASSSLAGQSGQLEKEVDKFLQAVRRI